MQCETFRDDMLSVLYGEADPAEAARFEAHRSRCAACAEEVAALRRLRKTLPAWSVPDRPRARSGARRWGWLAAAAALVLALGGGLALSGAHFQYARGPFAVSFGHSGEDVCALLAEQERRHLQELAALETRLAPAVPHDDAALVARVEAMIRDAEARQALALNATLRDFGEQTEIQRRYDLARVSAGLSYLEGKTGQQVARTTELMGYVLQASQQK